MNLIEVYIQEVTRRLPEKNREDIALELRSTIEDMLPDEYNESDVKNVLEKLGSPVLLANGYRDRPMHLIGPRYFDVYVTLLKMILPIATVISFISVIAEYVTGYHGNGAIINVVLEIIGFGIWKIIEVSIQTFFWLTIVFAVIERTDKGKDDHPLTSNLQKWTPEDLKNITYIPKKRAISKCEVFGGFLWTAIWATLYFNANHLVGIYVGGEDGLEFVTPALSQELLLQYWPIISIVIGLEIVLSIYKLIMGQWTKKMAIVNTILQAVATIGFIILVISPNLLTSEFISIMSELFTSTPGQFRTWFLGGVVFLFMISAAISVVDGFRKARIR